MRTLLLLLAFTPSALFAQYDLNVSFSNYLRYGSGKETVGALTRKRDYFENLGEGRISMGDFLVGFRILADAPGEFGHDTLGVTKRFAEFRTDDLYIRVGHSYSLFGRGLTMNLFENRALAYDTGIDGLKVEYSTELLKLAATGGDVVYTDVLDIARRERHRLRGISGELRPFEVVTIGGSFVTGEAAMLTSFFLPSSAKFDMPEAFGSLSWCNIDVFLAYAEKRTRIDHRGTAFYGSLGYTSDAFGIALDYKDYRFGIAPPHKRNVANRLDRAYAFQNMPIVHKEHSFTLLSRYPHVIDFNDEVGMQVDVFYLISNRITGAFNAAVSSRHYSFEQITFGLDYAAQPRDNSFLPSLKKELSPFWEVYTDVQWFLDDGGTNYIHVGFNRRSDTLAEELFAPPQMGAAFPTTRSTAIPFAIQYTVAEGTTVKFTSERQWVHEDANHVDPQLVNQLLTLGVSQSPGIGMTLRYEHTTDKATIDGRRDWFALDAAYRISPKHLLTLTYGADRGGQICANGVCRVVNPFRGFRASLLSYL